jgi:hypothetical protein
MNYIKPQSIFPLANSIDKESYIKITDLKNQEKLKRLWLSLRKADLKDIPKIDTLVYSRYSIEDASETSHFTSYRFVKYWNVFIIENASNDIVGCIYEQKIWRDVSFAIRLIIDSGYEWLGLPQILTDATYIAAIQEQSKVRRWIISFANQASHVVHLNKLGWSYTSLINEPLNGVQDHFEAEIWLEPCILSSPGLNHEWINSFLESNLSTFTTIPTSDRAQVRFLFQKYTQWRIIALLQKYWENEWNVFLFDTMEA